MNSKPFIMFMISVALTGCITHTRQRADLGAMSEDQLRPIVRQIEPGISLSRLRELSSDIQATDNSHWPLPVLHHLTIKSEGSILTVVSATLIQGMPFIFVFQDEQLHEVFDPSADFLKILQSASNVTQILDSIAISGGLEAEELWNQVALRAAARQRYLNQAEPIPFSHTWNLVLGTRKAYKDFIRDVNRVDGARIGLGDRIEDANEAFGKPVWLQDANDGTAIAVYGTDEKHDPYPVHHVYVSVHKGRIFEVITKYGPVWSNVPPEQTYSDN